MNELIEKENVKVEKMIYEIRGTQVMIDSDLARLYQCKSGTKEINQAVKNNTEKFPERFSWILTDEEYIILRSKFLTANIDNNTKRRYNPRVFTEQGVAMLATILKSKVAIQMSIAILDAFVYMRKYINEEFIEQKYINNLVLRHDEDIRVLQEMFSKFKEKSSDLFFNGQIYDAYSKILEIMKRSKNELIIIDAYADHTVLDIISKLDIPVILIVKNKGLLKKIDIEKYQQEYHNLKVIYNDNFHDRYFIIDKKEIYHSGASINHAGEKTFSINKLEDKQIINSLIVEINKIT